MKIEFAKSFKKSYKKISAENKEIFKAVLKKLANNEILEPKYKDHYLVGKYKGFKECHLKPDLLLIKNLSILRVIPWDRTNKNS